MIAILSSLSFGAPLVLLGLLVIPLTWILLRAIPPAPIRRIFPAVVLLLGLQDKKQTSDRTPWWLLLLRSLALAALIIGMAGPALNRQNAPSSASDVLLVVDGSWATGQGWSGMRELVEQEVANAVRRGVKVALLDLSAPASISFRPASLFEGTAQGLVPKPFDPDWTAAEEVIASLDLEGFDTIWFSDGLAHGSDKQSLLLTLKSKGAVSVYETERNLITISSVSLLEQSFEVRLHRLGSEGEKRVMLQAEGVTPNGLPAQIAALEYIFKDGTSDGRLEVVLPPELRKRITHFTIQGQSHAGARYVLADQLNRPEAAIVTPRGEMELSELLKPSYYVERALFERAEILDGAISDILPANPDIIIMADVVQVEATEDVLNWVQKGGTLVRFAGPRLAGAERSSLADDPLMPVMIRQGGRRLDGAMTWGAPKRVAPFPEDSPFFGLAIPDDLRVYAQILAEPGPQLSDKVIASLQDGTPLVTRNRLGLGQVVLIHVTANAEWSNLALSGLFPKMLERLSRRGADLSEVTDLAGQTWTPIRVLDGFGTLQTTDSLAGVAGESLLEGRFDTEMPPGIYQSGERMISRNLAKTSADLLTMSWPFDVVLKQIDIKERDLSGLLLTLAASLMIIDIIASLWISGRMRSILAVVFACACVTGLPEANAEMTDEDMVILTQEIALGYVITGNKRVDQISAEGLEGLSRVLSARTSVEPAAPFGLDLEEDELSFFPLLYWPITQGQPTPSSGAYAQLNTYLRSGGVIMFDTRDGDLSGLRSGANATLVELTRPLDIPRLEPVAKDHVLTRSFYLLSEFPGRFKESTLWVQASDGSDTTTDAIPFRRLNDGVTPVLIGGNDWASAWAVDEAGRAKYPVGRGFAGERQRELAFRFGVNLVMHVLTGNYKSDQVHVPALLERLGQ